MAIGYGGAGGYYVELSLDGLLVAAGLHSPAPDQLGRFRAAIDSRRAAAFERAVAAAGAAGLTLAEPELKRAPRGYPIDHPRIDRLRLKELTLHRRHELEPWLHEPGSATRGSAPSSTRRRRSSAGWPTTSGPHIDRSSFADHDVRREHAAPARRDRHGISRPASSLPLRCRAQPSASPTTSAAFEARSTSTTRRPRWTRSGTRSPRRGPTITIVFLEHPDLSEHWRHRSRRRALRNGEGSPAGCVPLCSGAPHRRAKDDRAAEARKEAACLRSTGAPRSPSTGGGGRPAAWVCWALAATSRSPWPARGGRCDRAPRHGRVHATQPGVRHPGRRAHHGPRPRQPVGAVRGARPRRCGSPTTAPTCRRCTPVASAGASP